MPAGDPSPTSKDCDGKNQVVEQITGESKAVGSCSLTSASSEKSGLSAVPERNAPKQSSNEEGLTQATPRAEHGGSTGGANIRPGMRENEDTRTPSSCSEGQMEQAREIDCDDTQEIEESLAEVREKRNAEAPPQSLSLDDSVIDNGVIQSSSLEEGCVGVPHVALLPRISLTPGERGPRASPALPSKSSRLEPPLPQQRGPLGALINWLDDADVDDVVDTGSLSELIPSQPPAKEALKMVGEHTEEHEDVLQPRQQSPLQDDLRDSLSEIEDDVPSDKEGLPKAPPLASQASPHLRPPTPDPFPSEQKDTGGYCVMPGTQPVEAVNEEEEWLARQRLTGAIGRLVRYCEEDTSPKDDILGLRSTRRGRIMVTAVRDRGIAMKAGVVAGDELVSIDGRKSFAGHPAHVVHASLKAPVVLVFLGFVGKLQAEVRVKRPPEPKCGLAPHMDVMRPVTASPSSSLQLCDAVVFNQKQSASLLITADNATNAQEKELADEGFPIAERTDSKTVMYELQREDAKSLVFNSLGTMAML